MIIRMLLTQLFLTIMYGAILLNLNERIKKLEKETKK